MLNRPIGFYVHHHGSGHATRAKQLATYWQGRRPVHILTSAPEYFSDWKGGRLHVLPPDISPERNPRLDRIKNGVFHYAPTSVDTIPERMAMISNFIRDFHPAAMIVDLSAELTQFCRLCGVPVYSVRLQGYRNDIAHLEAWKNSQRLIAPFAQQMEDDWTPQWVKDKTIYLGAISRYDDSQIFPFKDVKLLHGIAPSEKLILVVNGNGGSRHRIPYWTKVARRYPEFQWGILGKIRNNEEIADTCSNLHLFGYQSNTYSYLKAADLIIGSAGTNTVFEIGSMNKRFCCIPEERPFFEQLYKARSLQKLNLATVLEDYPSIDDWKRIIGRCLSQAPPDWSTYRGHKRFFLTMAELEQTIRVC